MHVVQVFHVAHVAHVAHVVHVVHVVHVANSVRSVAERASIFGSVATGRLPGCSVVSLRLVRIRKCWSFNTASGVINTMDDITIE